MAEDEIKASCSPGDPGVHVSPCRSWTLRPWSQGDVVQFSLKIDNRMGTQDEIFIGVNGRHPRQNPFDIQH